VPRAEQPKGGFVRGLAGFDSRRGRQLVSAMAIGAFWLMPFVRGKRASVLHLRLALHRRPLGAGVNAPVV